jgi:hypothetical protein
MTAVAIIFLSIVLSLVAQALGEIRDELKKMNQDKN